MVFIICMTITLVRCMESFSGLFSLKITRKKLFRMFLLKSGTPSGSMMHRKGGFTHG